MDLSDLLHGTESKFDEENGDTDFCAPLDAIESALFSLDDNQSETSHQSHIDKSTKKLKALGLINGTGKMEVDEQFNDTEVAAGGTENGGDSTTHSTENDVEERMLDEEGEGDGDVKGGGDGDGEIDDADGNENNGAMETEDVKSDASEAGDADEAVDAKDDGSGDEGKAEEVGEDKSDSEAEKSDVDDAQKSDVGGEKSDKEVIDSDGEGEKSDNEGKQGKSDEETEKQESGKSSEVESTASPGPPQDPIHCTDDEDDVILKNDDGEDSVMTDTDKSLVDDGDSQDSPKKSLGRGKTRGVGRGRGRGRGKKKSDMFRPGGSPRFRSATGVSVQENPELKRPFDQGWSRELVMRNTGGADDGPPVKMTSDVYYFTPEKKKLRSLVQVDDYLKLTGSDLTTKNFTFSRGSIYEPPYDIVRAAGRGWGRNHGPKSDKSEVGSTPAPLPKIKQIKKMHSSLPKIKLGTPKTTKSPTFTTKPLVLSAGKGASPVALFKNKQSNDSPTKSVASPFGSLIVRRGPVAKKRTGGKLPIKRPASNSNVLPPLKRMKPTNEMEGPPVLCGMECAGQEGIPPSLHCTVCHCLFHPSCVGHNPVGFTGKFLCNSCAVATGQKSNRDLSNGGTSPSLPPPPALKRISGSQLVSPPSQATAVRSINMNLAAAPNISGHMITLPAAVRQKLNTNRPLTLRINNQTLQVPPSLFVASENGVKVFLPPGLIPSNSTPQAAGGDNSGPRPVNLLTSQTDPQSLTVQQPAPSAAPNKVTNIEPIEIDPDSPTSSPMASPVKSKPSDTLLAPDSPQLLDVQGLKEPVSYKNKGQVKISQRTTRTGINPLRCHFQKLHAGYDCIQVIFKYLGLQDLLRASRVCRTWCHVGNTASLWKSVRLRNITVMNWEAAAQSFHRHRTQTLDLQGIQHCDGDKNRTWHQFTAILDSLKSLKHIHFGECPALILHSAAEKLCDLESLTAESITDTFNEPQMWTTHAKLDVGKFGSLKHLKILKLRGVCGLVLPAFSFSDGFTSLSNLTNLHTMSLTTLREVSPNDVSFLGSLSNLETLEIGDCITWDSDSYEQLGKLTKLKSLRLESSGPETPKSLGDNLKKLERLHNLELIKFAVDDHLAACLKSLTSLKTFTVWPNIEKAAQVNTAVMNAIKAMDKLEQLDWGIIPDVNTAGSGDDSRAASVPFLPPAPEPSSDDAEVNQLDPEYQTIPELMERLCDNLPETKIRVYRVPVHHAQRAAQNEVQQ